MENFYVDDEEKNDVLNKSKKSTTLWPSPDLLKHQVAIKGDTLAGIVITSKPIKSKKMIGKMFTGAAVLGYTAALTLDADNAIEATA